ncbi:MAG: hypothetical protein QE274_03850 [Verrucomicrobiaceae bacterium]|jgi:hypothetical protein|nr:hypothetical protein [Verrucomicrobiaceae bacterium]
MTIAVTPQIRMYLEDLTLKGTYGCSAAEAARMVLSKAIDDLVDRGSLQRRQFALKDNQVVAVDA